MPPTTPEVYVPKLAILKSAGFAQVVHSENTLSGNVDGTNKAFVTTYKPIIDSNYDDNVDNTDVTFYVNGVPVPVASVDSVSGTITLQTAPAVDSSVTADYIYSPIDDQSVCDAREEAQSHIDEIMSTLETVPYANYPATPPTIRKIARHYAAGLLLIPDYGSGSETDNTAKDGSARIARAEKWLQKYLEQGGLSGGDTNPFADADLRKAPDVFRVARRRHGSGSLTPVDDDFMQGGDDGLGGSNDDDWL